MKKSIKNAINIAYMPVYILGFVLLKLSRLCLAISYLMLLHKRQSLDILKSLFTTTF